MDAIVYTRDDDEYNLNIYDFIERPYAEERLEQSIRDVIEKCPNRNRWVFRSDYYER